MIKSIENLQSDLQKATLREGAEQTQESFDAFEAAYRAYFRVKAKDDLERLERAVKELDEIRRALIGDVGVQLAGNGYAAMRAQDQKDSEK